MKGTRAWGGDGQADLRLGQFLRFLRDSNHPKIQIFRAVSATRQRGPLASPTCYVTERPRFLISVKEVCDEEQRRQSRVESSTLARLAAARDSRDLNWLPGSYLVTIPPGARLIGRLASAAVRCILDAIRDDLPQANVSGLGSLKIRRFSELGKTIVFETSSVVSFIDSPGTIHKCIRPALGAVNSVFRSSRDRSVKKGVLLLVNNYMYGEGERDFIKALSFSYGDLIRFTAIDEIWLQSQSGDRSYVHSLLFERGFLQGFEKGSLRYSPGTAHLFESWFSALSDLGDEFKTKLFSSLKTLIRSRPPHKVFEDRYARQLMVMLGEWLAGKKRYDDVLWITNRFIKDADPPEPGKYVGDPRFDYHRQVADGEIPGIITTVLGHLAWVVQKIVMRPELISAALKYTERLLSHPNFYVKEQALVPLVEIAARRQGLDGYGRRPYVGTYKRFHHLVFRQVRFAGRHSNCKAIAVGLSRVFLFYKDLSTHEAALVLDTLKSVPSSSALFIYFGVYRERHYKAPMIRFSRGPLDKRLRTVIADTSAELTALRAEIARDIWGVLSKNEGEFDTLRPYIDLFLVQPYEKAVYDNLTRIIRDWIDRRPGVCVRWYDLVLARLAERFGSREAVGKAGGLWLMHTAKIIEALARQAPQHLTDVMGSLVCMWERGVYIGDLKELFESYRAITDEQLRKSTEQELRKLFMRMQERQPQVAKVEWT